MNDGKVQKANDAENKDSKSDIKNEVRFYLTFLLNNKCTRFFFDVTHFFINFLMVTS